MVEQIRESRLGSDPLPMCSAEELKNAARMGFVDADEEAEQPQCMMEDTIFGGDFFKLSPTQQTLLRMLKESSVYPYIMLKQLARSFSGASVFLYSPRRRDGTPMPSSVVKLDAGINVQAEVEKTTQYASLYGLTAPHVKDVQYTLDADVNEPSAVMQIDLCGGVFGIPELASGEAVQTLASVIQDQLRNVQQQADIIAVLTEAFERRMFAFTMSQRSVRRVDLMSAYKLKRFIGHGVLSRAEEGAKRGKNPRASVAGFFTPANVDALDPGGQFALELCGSRKSISQFFADALVHESTLTALLDREVVCGLCHNDLHGGNLLLDTQGLVWLIDFATVKANVPVLMDISKFVASCLFMYLPDDVDEKPIKEIAKLFATAPDSSSRLPIITFEQGTNGQMHLLWSILSRMRCLANLYEEGDDTPTSDGLTFVVGLCAWSTRMLSFTEPSLTQKRRAVYFAMACMQRLLWQTGTQTTAVADHWIRKYQAMWSRPSGVVSANRPRPSLGQLTAHSYQIELPRFLSQVGSIEAWQCDMLTREKVHVADHCITAFLSFNARFGPKLMDLSPRLEAVLEKLRPIHERYLPQLLTNTTPYFGRLVVVGDAGTGKSILTKQMLAAVAHSQVAKLCGNEDDSDAWIGASAAHLIPIRVPMIDLARMLETEADIPLHASPERDLLSKWMRTKYGQDSVPYKLVQSVRRARGSHAQLRDPRTSPRIDPWTIPGIGPGGSPIIPGVQRVTPEQGSLFLLLDGFDEASTAKAQCLQFIESLLESEPGHVVMITTRPGTLGPREFEKLSALSFASFSMRGLTDAQAVELATLTMRRCGDEQCKVDAVLRDLQADGYKALRQAPMVLSMLVHVLREFHGRAPNLAATAPLGTLTQIQQVYQRALNLTLQSDLGKFLLRDTDNDRAMVRRLQLLKGARGRKYLQAVAWHAHCARTRALSWDAIEHLSDDKEVVDAFKEAFQQDRTPLFEKVTMRHGEPMVQLCHLLFQELLAAEYATAVFRHAHAIGKMRAYVNVCMSEPGKQPERQRVSDSWWTHVWLHVLNMLEAGVFQELCSVLAEDQKTHLKIGSHVCLYDDNRFLFRPDSEPTMLPWASPGCMYEVTDIDWQRHRVCLKWIEPAKSDLFQARSAASFRGKDTCEMSDVIFPANGVACILREAVRVSNLKVVKELVQNKVHYGCADENYTTPFNCAMAHGQREAFRLLLALKADLGAFPCNHVLEMNRFAPPKSFIEDLTLFSSVSELRRSRPMGALKQALLGTLDAESLDLDPHYVDPKSGMTLLMFAAAGGDAAIVRGLLERRARVDVETAEGCTALTFAAECSPDDTSSIRCLEMLVAARADVNHKSGKSYESWLMERHGLGNPVGNAVCLYEHEEKLEALLKLGYQANLGNDYNMTPVFWAAKKGNVTMTKRLIDARADFINARLNEKSFRTDGFHGATVMGTSLAEFLTSFPPSWDYDIIKLMLESGYDPHHVWSTRRCPEFPHASPSIGNLFLSTWGAPCVKINNDLSLLKLFIEHNLDVNHYFTRGHAKHLVSFMGAAGLCKQSSVIRFLLDNKGEPHGNDIHMEQMHLMTGSLSQITDDCFEKYNDHVEINFFLFALMSSNHNAVTAYTDWKRCQDELDDFDGYFKVTNRRTALW